MSWHSFVAGQSYSVRTIVDVLQKHLEAGGVLDVRSKAPLLELFLQHLEEAAIFSPFGGAWGCSPYNPNVWKKADGTDLITGYRQPRTRKRFSPKVRSDVMQKTGGHCYSCGKKFASAAEVWIEHVIPFSVGGSDATENLLPGCRICNYTRQNFTPRQIQRILSIGAAVVRELDRETELGARVLRFLKQESARLRANRKHKEHGFLVFESESSPRPGDTPAPQQTSR